MVDRCCWQCRHASFCFTFLTIIAVASRADDAEQRFTSQVGGTGRESGTAMAQLESAEFGEQRGELGTRRILEKSNRGSGTTQNQKEDKHKELEDKVDESEEEEEEEEFDQSDVVCGVNLLGFVVFIMTLYYLVNWPDADMVIYVWTVISTTISIFLAVFAFSSVKLAVEKVLLKGEHTSARLATLGFVQVIVWFSVMQVSVAVVSGVMDEHPFRRDLPLDEQKMGRKIEFKSIASLLAHCTGFAAINFGGCLQHLYPFNLNSYARFLVIPLMYVAQILAGRLVRIVRVRIKDRILKSIAHAGELDSYHSLEVKGFDHEDMMSPRDDSQVQGRCRKEEVAWCLETWDEETYEAELDVAGLSISFLLVQSLRVTLTGVMPNTLGIEDGSGIHPQSCSIMMVLFGLLFAVLCVIHVVMHEYFFPKEKEVKPLTCESAVLRMIRVMQISFAMAFAWSLFVASKWEIARYLPQYKSNGVVSRVILTVELSFIAFWFILVLDKLADAKFTGDTTDRAIITIIGALSTLVGFAYEQSFDGAVEALAAICFKPHKMMGELVLTLGVWIIVYPAWRKYILRKLLELKEERRKSPCSRASTQALDEATLT